VVKKLYNRLVSRSSIDEFVKSYIMPLCGTVTENNLSIISNGYDLVIGKYLSSGWLSKKAYIQGVAVFQGRDYTYSRVPEKPLQRSR